MQFLFTTHFKKQIKRIQKKFPKLKEDLIESLEAFELKQGIYIGKSIYKIRIKSSDQNKGKSGGFRIYAYFYIKKDILIPLCIYSKNEIPTISQNELEYHFENTLKELF
ncbi:MAG: hypothetical protein WC285_04285 [Candidatus Gracilibacteria bacterium]|jgi:mRNA-degrading endonuclease RelE of RelBE toxin-antitoxin system